MPDLNEFQEWVSQGKRRKADIRLYPNQKPHILVGDYDETNHYQCQIVNSVSEINLKQEIEKRERADYERLKAKFESEAV